LRPGAFDPPLTATRSPLQEGWPHLARLLAAAVDGVPVRDLQMVGEARLIERGSVAPPRAQLEGEGALTDEPSEVS